MRKSLSSNLLVARVAAILSATLLFACVPIAIGQQEQAKSAPEDKKPTQQSKPEAKDKKQLLIPTVEGHLIKANKPAEPALEEMLNKALKENPDIKVAEAKLREADAELNRTRLQVTQKVLAFHHAREAQKAVVKAAEDGVARVRKLQKSNAVPEQAVTQAEDGLAQAKAKLAELEAEMPYLLGQQGAVLSVAFSPDGRWLTTQSFDREVKLWDAATGKQLDPVLSHDPERLWSVRFSPDGKRLLATGIKPIADTMLDKIRKALETPVTVDYKQMSAAEILKDLEKKVPGISFHVLVSSPAVDLHLDGAVPLGAALQLIEDTITEFAGPAGEKRCAFAIRDYGVLFTVADRIPPGAIQLDDLLKEKAFAERQKDYAERAKKQTEGQKSTSDKK